MNEIIIDLYAEFCAERGESSRGYLKIVKSENVKNNSPAMLVVAGGGYNHVSLREQDCVAREYSKKGFVCFVLDYTVNQKYPVACFEAMLAMAYIRKNSVKYNIDAEKVVGIGFSAGAHLLGCVAILPIGEILKKWIFKTSIANVNNLKNLVKPNALIMCYPVVTAKENKCHKGSFEVLCCEDNRLMDKLSLEKSVSVESPPAFIWHTFTDASVPVYNSLALALAYEQNGVPFSLHIYGKGKHGLSLATSEMNDNEALNNASVDICGWFDLSINWLKELNFQG